MKKIPFILKKYLKINLILFFMLGILTPLIIYKVNGFYKKKIMVLTEEGNVDNYFKNFGQKLWNELIFNVHKEKIELLKILESLEFKNKEELIILFKKFFKDFELKNELYNLISKKEESVFISKNSFIKSLNIDNNKYLIGTHDNGFYLLEFNIDNDSFKISKIKDNNKDEILDLTIDNVSGASSIQSLGNNKYLIGTHDNGFYLLIFSDSNNSFEASRIFKILDDGSKYIYHSHNKSISNYSSIQSLGNNKYLIGTHNQGFYLFEFDNEKNSFSSWNKITDLDPEVNENEIWKRGEIGKNSSIQSLGNDKYLVGTFHKGFCLFVLNNYQKKFTVSKIKDKNNNNLENLTEGYNSVSSSIQSLRNNKYLVGTYERGFYLLKFNDENDSFIALKIKDKDNQKISKLSFDNIDNAGKKSLIYKLGDYYSNKYLIGTFNKGFYLLEFNDNDDSFTSLKIKDENNQEISDLRSREIGAYSSIESLGNNKYLLGTYDKGFYLLNFNNENNSFEIKNIIKNEFYIKNIFLQRLLNEIAKSWETNQFFWENLFDIFDKNDIKKTILIKENFNFDNFDREKLIKLIKLIFIFKDKIIFKNFLPNLNNKLKNIIKFLKWLRKKDINYKSLFKVLISIKNDNPLTIDFFNENGLIKEELINDFSLDEYYDIKVWFKNIFFLKTEDLENHLIDKTNQKLINIFNDNKMRKKIVKLIIGMSTLPDNFFKHNFEENGIETRLSKNSFVLIEDEIGQMKINTNWNISLDISTENLENYIFWIDSLDENKYKELLEYIINELLNKNNDFFKMIIEKEKIESRTADETLEIEVSYSFTHEDFNDDGSLKENLTTEKLEEIKNWIVFKWINLLKNDINDMLNNNEKEKKELIFEVKKITGEEDKILGLDIVNNLSHTDFNQDGLLNEDDIFIDKLNLIKNWLESLNSENSNIIILKLIEKKIQKLLEKNDLEFKNLIKEAKKNPNTANETLEIEEDSGISHEDFNDDGSLKNDLTTIKLKIIKNWLIKKEKIKKNLKEIPNFIDQISEIDKVDDLIDTDSKDSKEKLKKEILEVKKTFDNSEETLENDKDFHSLNEDFKIEEKLSDLNIQIINLLENNDLKIKNQIKKALENKDTADEVLGLDKIDGISNIDFKDDGLLLNVTKNNEVKLKAIKLWLSKLSEKKENILTDWVLIVSISVVLIALLTVIGYYSFRNYKRKKSLNIIKLKSTSKNKLKKLKNN